MTVHQSLADFIGRTKENLNIITNRKHEPKDEKYEVTQLMNSLLGLFMFPQQYYNKKSMPSFTAPDKSCFPQIRQTVEKGTVLKPARDINMEFKEVIHHLRNSIAHYKVKFSDNDEMIKGVEFTDDNKYRNGDRFDRWVITFDSVEKLKKFVEHFSTQIGKFAETGSSR